MAENDETDVELLRRFQKGDIDAFDRFVRLFQDRIYRMAAVWLYDAQHAADVTQEVFLRSFKGLRSFRFGSTPFTWLYRTTRNVCHEYNRRRTTDELPSEPIGATADIEQQVTRYQAAQSIRELVAVLPARQREVIVLRIFEDCSVRETAKAMGCREGTVKALLHKATARLKMNIQADADQKS